VWFRSYWYALALCWLTSIYPRSKLHDRPRGCFRPRKMRFSVERVVDDLGPELYFTL